MKRLLALTLAASFATLPVVSAQGLSSTIKDHTNNATSFGAGQAEPGTLPLRSGRSVRRDGKPAEASVIGEPDASPHICTNCDD